MWSIALLHVRGEKELITLAFWRYSKISKIKDGKAFLLHIFCLMLCLYHKKRTSFHLQSCSFFIYYLVNIRLIILPHFSKKRNIQDGKEINEISKMEQDQSQTKVEIWYCFFKNKIHVLASFESILQDY